MAFRAPLLGYNTNVRHKGKLYHIQTEDSGIDHPHVITHLFADGGRIVASKKTSYADRVGSDGLPDQVKKLMQGQHKAMFISLRDGIYDEDATVVDDVAEPTAEARPDEPEIAGPAPHSASIELDGVRALEAPPPPPPAALAAAQVDELDQDQMATTPPRPGEGSLTASRARLYEAAPAPGGQPAQGWGAQAAHGPAAPGQPKVAAEASHPAGLRPRVDEPRAAASSSDVGLSSSVVPKANGGARSLFGGDLLSDKSLDEVILNYLAANEKDG